MTLFATTAHDLMTPGSFSLPDTTPAEDAAAFLTDVAPGAAVVLDAAGRPVGVVSKTDLLVHVRELVAAGNTAAATVRDVMTPVVFSCPADSPARTVVEQLVALNVHHLFVVDSAGSVIGAVSPWTVLRKLG